MSEFVSFDQADIDALQSPWNTAGRERVERQLRPKLSEMLAAALRGLLDTRVETGVPETLVRDHPDSLCEPFASKLTGQTEGIGVAIMGTPLYLSVECLVRENEPAELQVFIGTAGSPLSMASTRQWKKMRDFADCIERRSEELVALLSGLGLQMDDVRPVSQTDWRDGTCEWGKVAKRMVKASRTNTNGNANFGLRLHLGELLPGAPIDLEHLADRASKLGKPLVGFFRSCDTASSSPRHLAPGASMAPHPLPATILRALRTKPFVLLPGISGTGKTQLARRLAGWAVHHGTCGPELLDRDGVTAASEEAIFDVTDPDAQTPPDLDAGRRIAFLPVRPDWTEASMFWGYYNPLTGFYYPTPATRVLLDAWRHFVHDPDGATGTGPTHFLILDEMNLARVEYYFSDLLSLMEAGPRQHADHWTSGEVARIHDFAAPLRIQSPDDDPRARPHLAPEKLSEPDWLRELLLEGRGNARVDAGDAARDALLGAGTEWVPPFLPYPPNLAILGTVNIDETTHAFSPKVLDRAFVFEFLEWGTPGLEEPRPSSGDVRKFEKALHELNKILRKSRHHFGHRVFNEARRFLGAKDKDADVDAGQLDWLVLTRILPKIRGSRGEVGPVLEELTNELDKDSYPLSHQKLQDMKQRLGDTGFTAYF